MLVVTSPLFLVAKNFICWWCGEEITVVGIVSDDVADSENGEENRLGKDAGDFFLLTNIEALPSELLAEIQVHSPSFGKAISATAKPTYFANVCVCCNGLQGEYHVHSEPDKGIVPSDDADCADMHVTTLNYSGRFQTEASVAPSTPIQSVLRRHLTLPPQN